jgi:diguanylate cyclase (GGDEF)-like protein/PAS domain S-box-containing protein
MTVHDSKPSDLLSGRLAAAQLALFGNLAAGSGSSVSRSTLVAKSRWFFLALIGIYSVLAGAFYSFSRFGFFLSEAQQLFLGVSLCAVVGYNAFSHFGPRTYAGARFANIAQVILDIFFVSVIIHFTGGAASWFWPVYILVTIEAAYLLETTVSVWLLGFFGSLVFGALLGCEYAGVIDAVRMPFVDPSLHSDYLYLLLLWFWVALLNTAAAFISTYLMTVIRMESDRARRGEERLTHFIESANDLIHSTTVDGDFLFVNQAWRATMGYTLEDLAGKTIYDLVPEASRPLLAEELKMLRSGERVNLLETVFRTRSGDDVVVEGSLSCAATNGDGHATIWGICRDVTERKEIQRQLFHLAHFDALTGLPNRVLFVDRLKQTKAQTQRRNQLMAVAFLDLDRFKVINDTLGHPLGDKLLQAVASRLQSGIRQVDTLARIGGDEFVIILGNLKEQADAERVTAKLMQMLAQPFVIDQHELFITCSIGISLFPRDDEDLDNLIKKADLAMYAAKGKGKCSFCFYSSEMDEHAHKRFVLENGLRKAIERQEFLLYYQPKVDVLSGQITSMEALLRWAHPELGIVAPADFIPLAEESGLIIPLGEWVLTEACRQNKLWQDEGSFRLRVAVNLSGYQLQRNDFIATVHRVLTETQLAPEFLELEITETVIMQHPEYVVGVLSQLRDLGIHISIDDFGTGYSSLSHLKKFSVNTLKIDKSFVKDIETNKTDAAIASAIVSMGNSLNLRVVAEGVETEAQFTILQDTRCDEVQGYLFSKPLPAGEVVAFIQGRRTLDG